MGRKKKNEITEKQVFIANNSDKIIEKHLTDLDKDPELSLFVDPTNKYNMSQEQKDFVHWYCELKSLQLVQAMLGITTEVSNAYYMSYSSQQEIRRINRAMLHRRFHTKMLNIEQIGGYLTSLITDENVPYSERLSSKDKVGVANMLMQLNQLKADTMNNTNVIDYKDVEEAAKSMSIDTIKMMLSNKRNGNDVNSQKETLISQMNVENTLLPEEIDYLKTLSVPELLQLINSIEKK